MANMDTKGPIDIPAKAPIAYGFWKIQAETLKEWNEALKLKREIYSRKEFGKSCPDCAASQVNSSLSKPA